MFTYAIGWLQLKILDKNDSRFVETRDVPSSESVTEPKMRDLNFNIFKVIKKLFFLYFIFNILSNDVPKLLGSVWVFPFNSPLHDYMRLQSRRTIQTFSFFS